MMVHGVCPHWLGYALINPLRRLVEDPRHLLAPLVAEGSTVVEPGCGMGFFTLEIARLVGAGGRVVALDVQPRMLQGLQRRAAKAGLANRIDGRLVSPGKLELDDVIGAVDLVLALHVVHEVPDQRAFFAELRRALRPRGRFLIVEPPGHVTAEDFGLTLATAASVGLSPVDAPLTVRRRRLAALLERNATSMT
jgi:SAM-dependent methyltransferase